MSNKLPSPKTYKISSIICFIFCGICMFIGILSFAVGGFLFIIFGALFLYLGLHYRKKEKIWTRIKNRQVSQNIKSSGSNYVYVNKKSKAYHDDVNCRGLKPNYDLILWSEAVSKGLTRCKLCHPQQW